MSDQKTKLFKQVILWATIVAGIIALLLPLQATSIGVMAQSAINPCDINPQSCVEGLPGAGADGAIDIIYSLARWLSVVAVALTVLFMVWGGFLWITAGGSEERASAGSRTVKNALLGLIITVLSFGIVSLIVRFIFGVNIGL